jgi:hypothetical protein
MKFKELILIAVVCANITLGAVALTLYVAKAEPAAQAASTSRAGDYVMTTGVLNSGRESVLIVDVVAKRANLYAPKNAAGAPPGGTWELTSSRSLADDFKKP